MAIALTIGTLLTYIPAIVKGAVQPHLFSWVICGCTIFVAFPAYRRQGDLTITHSDWVFFVAALSALPTWYLTADAL